MAQIAFIGLGVMGYPMAGFLAAAGHQVIVYNRTTSKAQAWVAEHGGAWAPTPALAAQGADVVCCCVGNDDDLRSVVLGAEGAFACMAPSSLFIDHTTASAEVARELAAEATRLQIGFVDAPVSGGQAGAENGQLAIMCGGSDGDYGRAEKIMAAYAKSMTHLGAVGAGQLTKMVNQICIAGLVQGLSEAINFGLNSGLKMENVIEVISKGAAQSWQMENRYKTMINDKFNFGFAVDWMRKDLKIAIDEAKKNNSPLPITKIIDEYYGEVQKMGGNRWDTSSLIRRLRKK